MAKLSPPIVAGTIPPFYKNLRNGTVKLTVPFGMNKVVSISEVKSIGLRLKDGTTDQRFFELESLSWVKDINNPSVTFNLGDPATKGSPASKLIVGNYYKIQLAYYDLSGRIGYYSTIAITKYTTQPAVSLLNFNRYVTNVDTTHYIGSYVNVLDASEKVYQYKFTLCDLNKNVLETSGWLTHNVNTNVEQGKSQDEYDLTYSIQPNTKYTIQYSVLTNNGLECNSPRYQLVGSKSIKPELDATLLAELDYNAGAMKLWLRENYMPIIDPATRQRQAAKLTGAFILVRSSSAENFNVWTKLYSFYLAGKLPEDFIFIDYTLEQGQTYRYAVQQFNDQGVYSDRMLAKKCEHDNDDVLHETDETEILAAFEDMFLFDGERQLKIRFNPKVTSFKTVVQEAKKNTLGSKYPFFFRSGATEYKEFPIGGLISYLGDENEEFMLRSEELKMPLDWTNDTDITDDNLTYERRFKLTVLNWLNDGKVKLFRSPGEGNYLVRLMNVQLQPEDSLSRMIHSFTCTASEVDEYKPSKLAEYGFLTTAVTMPAALRFGSINLDEFIEEHIAKLGKVNITSEDIEAVLADLADNVDLLNGLSCQYIHFEDCWPDTKFQLGEEIFWVGATGNYEATFDDQPFGLYLKNPRRHMAGTIHYGVMTTQSNVFDAVHNVSQYDVLETIDYGELLARRSDQTKGPNYIEATNTIKKRINKIYFMNFYLNDLLYEFESMEQFQQRYHILMDSEHEEQYRVYLSGRVTSKKGVFTKEEIEQMHEIRKYGEWAGSPNNSTFTFNFNDFMAQYYDTKVSEGAIQFDYIARGAQDLYIDNTLIRTMNDGRIWRYQIGTYYSDGGAFYGMYATITPVGYTNDLIQPTYVYIDNEVIDISLTGGVSFPITESIPKSVYFGSAVTMCACYQILEVTYGEEFNFHQEVGKPRSLDLTRQLVDESYKLYCAEKLDLIPDTDIDLKLKLNEIPMDADEAYFTWQHDRFYRMSYEDCIDYNGSDEVWICNSGIKYDDNEQCYVNNISNRKYYSYVSRNPFGSSSNAVHASAFDYPVYNNQYLEWLQQALADKGQELTFDDD